jgi:16S rRNA (guanine966-N2)-methyltransferase
MDLFAGTGALGFEALSRGASHATFFEQHFPTGEIIRDNAVALELADRCQVVAGNTFIQLRRANPLGAFGGDEPWVVFSSPPYSFYVDRRDDMLQLLARIESLAPSGSIVVVEADEQFDFGLLNEPTEWDLRDYSPAYVGLRWM